VNVASSRIRVGISGWRYAPWRGTFYPEKLPQRLELAFASKIFPVIEINGTFYALQRPENYAEWYRQTPADFVFSVKAPRYITHMRRLKNIGRPVANFFASGLFNLREKLGPILWQFPPNFAYDAGRMREFLTLLPRDMAGAAALARKRDSFMAGRTRLAIDANRRVRHALEIRHESFVNPGFVALLAKYKVALVVAETAHRWPMIQDITADFLYMRLHGDKELYRSGYGDEALTRWAMRMAAWHRGGEPSDVRKVVPGRSPAKKIRDVYCFFDNTDVKLRAPFDAQTLMKKLGVAH
jgi:uncharacterized protein YecE (DUF72 family)